MIDRTKNVDDNSGNFDKTMDKMLHTDKKKKGKK